MKEDIYTLAHEIKNPLCVAKGYLEMMNKDNLEKYIKIIQEEINTSIEILDNYINYNKICLNKEEIDLNILLLDIKESMKDYLKIRGLNLKLEMDDDEIYIETDYNKMKQVLYNLIKNSIESHSKNIMISYKRMFGKIILSFKKDGQKINEENLYKIGNNYTNKICGHGIGTTINKKIIELSGGSIKYRNNKDKGIKALITLNLV